MFRPDTLKQLFSLLHFFAVTSIDDLALRDRFHAFKNPAYQLINDPIQNMSRVARLPVTVRLFAGFTIADIPHPLDDPVGIVFTGVCLSAGGKGEPRSTMAAKNIPR